MMNKTFTILLFFLCISLPVVAQVFPVDTIQSMGDSDKRINIVFIGDGYLASEMDKYKQDVIETAEDLFDASPLLEYRPYFNVFAINVPSLESGVSHPGTANDEAPGSTQPVESINNYFGSTFDFGGIHRLVVAQNGFAINNVMAANFPNYDQVVILANSTYYGGSGGSRALTTTHSSASAIAIHEIGHSFADLRDEYYAGDNFSQESANMTKETNPDLVRWKNCYGEQCIGINQHCCSGNSAEWYRPHQSCKMRSLSNDFCAVCKETFVETFHSLVSPIDSYTPIQFQVNNNGQDLWFKSNLIHPTPNTLEVTWELNGTTLSNSTEDSLLINPSMLNTGVNQLTMKVIDQTPLSRSDSHPTEHTYFVNWQIEKTTTSIQTTGEQRALAWTVFPNPLVDQVNLEYELDRAAEIEFRLYDQNGRLLQQKALNRQEAGTHKFQMQLSDYPAGTYFLRWIVGDVILDRSLLKVNAH